MSTEHQRGKFTISTDKSRLDLDFVHDYLCNQSYWAQGRTREIVAKSIRNSLCFGVYDQEKQVGFARVVTDYVTFAWLCDLFIVPNQQGRGLGKWLVQCVVAHPDMKAVKCILLATHNAHELYRRYGDFEVPRNLEKWMVRYRDKG